MRDALYYLFYRIYRYLGSSKSERHLFILLEYVPGGSISGMLASYGAFSEDLLRYVYKAVHLYYY